MSTRDCAGVSWKCPSTFLGLDNCKQHCVLGVGSSIMERPVLAEAQLMRWLVGNFLCNLVACLCTPYITNICRAVSGCHCNMTLDNLLWKLLIALQVALNENVINKWYKSTLIKCASAMDIALLFHYALFAVVIYSTLYCDSDGEELCDFDYGESTNWLYKIFLNITAKSFRKNNENVNRINLLIQYLSMDVFYN